MEEVVSWRFGARELNADGTTAPAEWVIAGSTTGGWVIERNGLHHLSFGRGYRLLRSERCGVCSTDLDRPFLPFPLPQVIGHEMLARDENGVRCVVEINASHRARGEVTPCAFCDAGLANHCPDRRVLGIHDLPGGFGRHVLAPVRAVLPVPESIPDDVAVLVEPFAAALHAVDRIAPREGDHIAVLGTGRLGLLVVAALAAQRRAQGAHFRIEAWSRRAALRERALALGADTACDPPAAGHGPGADVVIDTTGSPEGFALALSLAVREVHLKSTHGRASGGLAHATALVVDELGLRAMPTDPVALVAALDGLPIPGGDRPLVAWLCEARVPASLEHAVDVVRGRSAAELLEVVGARRDRLPRFDLAVVDRAARIDEAIRPDATHEISLVRPRGLIWLHPERRDVTRQHAVAHALIERDLAISTSRCGDFGLALALLDADATLRAGLARLVTHHLPASRLDEAFALARSPEAIKVVVDHDEAPDA